MGSLSFSEIMVIVLVILIVFGPRRLPELARRAGDMMRKAREASASVTDALGDEYESTVAPIRDVKRDYDDLKGDLTKAVSSMGHTVDETIEDDEDGAEAPDHTDEPPNPA